MFFFNIYFLIRYQKNHLLSVPLCPRGFPAGSVVKNPPAMQETWVRSLDWEDTLEDTVTHSSILAWRIPKDRGGWPSAVPGVAKELNTT